MKYQCVRCGKIKETKQEMLTCSGACRVAYHRYLKAGNPPIDPIRIDDVTPDVTPTLQNPPAHEQAYSPPEGHKLITDEMHDLFMQLLREKKSGNQTTIFMPLSETTAYTEGQLIDPPTAIEESPEMKKKREDEARKRSIANTLAAIDDF